MGVEYAFYDEKISKKAALVVNFYKNTYYYSRKTILEDTN